MPAPGAWFNTPATATTTVNGTVQWVDIGGGTNGVVGTASFHGRHGDVPFSVRNSPLKLEAPADASNNFQQNWSLQLDLQRKLVRTKQQTVASAQLQLPNGDTIAFPERVVKYSPHSGYTLAFQRGTNLTVHPSTIDRQSSLLLKQLLFVQQGTNWQATNGVITYKFLGQKGTANLKDFLTP